MDNQNKNTPTNNFSDGNNSNQSQNNQRPFLIWTVAILVVLILVGGLFYFYAHHRHSTHNNRRVIHSTHNSGESYSINKKVNNANQQIVEKYSGSNQDKVVQGNNAFALNLYHQLKSKKGNLFFSPYSISSALAMTYSGARAKTEEEMAKVLHFSLKQKLLHPAFFKLQSRLNVIEKKGDIQLSIANSLWAQKEYHFLDSFLNLNKKYYNAGLKFVDFKAQTEQSRQAINAWVEGKTHNKIKELIKPGLLDPLTRLVLCNAIYFKGKWLIQFDKKKTIDSDFWVSSDKSIKVPMMSQKGNFRFKDFGRFKAIELPYKGKELSMVIFLSKDRDGIAGLEKNLTNKNIKKWISELTGSYKTEVLVSLPKFKTTSEFELSNVLGGMGMKSAFSLPPADFSGMTGKKDLFISKVIHQAFIDVNEEGTEAAAATAVVVMRKGISKLLTFYADHPFIFLIRENKTSSILFMGRVVNPKR